MRFPGRSGLQVSSLGCRGVTAGDAGTSISHAQVHIAGEAAAKRQVTRPLEAGGSLSGTADERRRDAAAATKADMLPAIAHGGDAGGTQVALGWLRARLGVNSALSGLQTVERLRGSRTAARSTPSAGESESPCPASFHRSFPTWRTTPPFRQYGEAR